MIAEPNSDTKFEEESLELLDAMEIGLNLSDYLLEELVED
ncbi:conserved hypothetical protein [Vibrio nigripulchritudo SO65]|nr:conserved hypothetical protein [Vibrio nigripulchritudo AM115]CCN43021.1 conserved hypothetical protein [Vibrio nigripulchritudo FTn2]CCN65529.1 conserved hypothetical protein [Vibrio nigripulchritudo POn4]CCN75223.1 conserved hypothetical protein [Vibrio nigripulchritudo SO65]